MDAWITPDPLLKYRPEGLSKTNLGKQNDLRRAERSDGILPSALRTALKECDFAPTQALADRLFDVALKRINEVRKQWMMLTEGKFETFASIWAKGAARRQFPQLNLKYRGIPDPIRVSPNEKIPNVDCLDQPLIRDLHSLVEDAMEYIEWTLKWPMIVQVVRSIDQGTLKTDLNFRS